jgi:hypothetical protein
MITIELGREYQDAITGYTGVAIGHVTYLTGCNQTLLQPRCGNDKIDARPVAEWFDDQRMRPTVCSMVISLDNGATPGHDRAAPKR